MEYDIIFITGEVYFDHPLCGVAVLKRLLEEKGFTVAVIEMPTCEDDIKMHGIPRLFFGVSSGGIDSMVRNYTPLKKPRVDDKHADYYENVPDRAIVVYSNWVRKNFKTSKIIIGGAEATLRRFTHYDYWQNRLRRSILFDSRADILAYGPAEKQTIEIAQRLKNKKDLKDIKGTCILSKTLPEGFKEMPSHEEVSDSKEKFCDMQNLFSIKKDLAQKDSNWYVLQYKMPEYTTKDLDHYYSLPFSRDAPKELRGFQFSVVTHRGCFGNCNFCSLKITQGEQIISRSEESIVKEIKTMAKHPQFRGNVDDLTGPSINMYGMDCCRQNKSCLDCPNLDRTNKRLISLLRNIRKIPGVNKVYLKSGVRYDLASPALIKEIAEHHIFDTLRVAPEHVNKNVLRLMNKDRGNLKEFHKEFKRHADLKKLSYYFITAHPGSTMKEAQELADFVSNLHNAEHIQVFTPTPMSDSTCMYYTGLDPKTKKPIYVPYTYNEKKEQKRAVMRRLKDSNRRR